MWWGVRVAAVRCGRVGFCDTSSSMSSLRLRVAALRKFWVSVVVWVGDCCLVFAVLLRLGNFCRARANSFHVRHACTYRLHYALAYHNTTNSKPSRDGPPICRIRMLC